MSKKNSASAKGISKKLTVPEVIDYCKNDLGILFNLTDEKTAANFLEKHNYFFRIKQYADAWPEKTKSGKFIGVEFAYLVELSIIDMFFRKLIFKMTIDLEHYLKVKLVNYCQNNSNDDGYKVVEEFLKDNPALRTSIQTMGSRLNVYRVSNFEPYVEHPAVWNFVEMINFYDFVNFYSFYYEYFKIESVYTKHFDSVRRLRNASAHNSCMLCSFVPVHNFKYDVEVSFKLLQADSGISPGVISSCLKIPVLNDFTVLLDLYTDLITSPKIKEKTLEEVKEFFDGRMIYHKEYFENNSYIKNAYKFAHGVLDFYSRNIIK